MIQDWKCDENCINETNWNRVNPVDFAAGRCGCQPPVSPQQVVDFCAQDFYTISLEEWMNIAEKNPFNLEELEQDVT